MEPIAIIGIGCRFPGANGPGAFWRLLREGTDAIGEVPIGRWTAGPDAGHGQDSDAPCPWRWGGFVDGIDLFDPDFFGISPREAAAMDPQQRMALEVAWEALEDAGLVAPQLARSPTGVFLGISTFDHTLRARRKTHAIDIHSGIGAAHSIAANRISYAFDLRGPSIAVDTACSSSLVAAHLACQSLRRGECGLALAGGVNVMTAPETTIAFARAQMLAKDHRCKAFDARADGYVRGEGAGFVVLKPLAHATADGDAIVAVIRGSAVNQDGKSNGLTAPNPEAQVAVIRQACHEAGVAPGELQYVEAHGTGTPLGDPIEIKALARALADGRARGDSCAVGSVKTNIGHLESAAGIAGLIKAALALQHREIPPSLHFRTPNPHIPFADLCLRVQDRLEPWPERESSARAGVSSFGFGGTNAHMILEAPPPAPPPARAEEGRGRWHVLKVTAKSQAPLARLAERYADLLVTHPDTDDLCAAANLHRTGFRQRLVVTGQDRDDLGKALRDCVAGRDNPGVHAAVAPSRPPRLAFLFTGQGSQYAGMARRLLESEPVFRDVVERCDSWLKQDAGFAVADLLYAAGDEQRLEETVHTQPALFVLGCALARLLESWGVRPDVVAGHSLGEYTAACVAGAFSIEDGLRLVTERGRLMQERAEPGAMAAIMAGEAEVRRILGGWPADVSLAARNAPDHIVLSGPAAAVDAALAALRQANVRARPLSVTRAFHSALMEPMLGRLETAVRQVAHSALRVPLVSNLEGRVSEPESVIESGHWLRHTREPVDFAAAVSTLAERGCEVCLEIGPNPVLCGLGGRSDRGAGLHWVATLRRGDDDRAALANALAELHVRGVEVDWRAYHGNGAYRRLRLPSYPFDHKRFPIDPEEDSDMAAHPAGSISPAAADPGRSGDRTRPVLERLRRIAAALLWTEPDAIDPHVPLIEMGADSVLLIELLTKVESAFDTRLPLERFYKDLTSLDKLAAHLAATVPEEQAKAAGPGSTNGHSAATAGKPETPPSREEIKPPSALPANPGCRARDDETAHLPDFGANLGPLFTQQLEVMRDVLDRQLDVLRLASGQPSEQAAQGATNGEVAKTIPSTGPGVEQLGAAPARHEANLTAQQRRHLASLQGDYTRRTRRSKRYAAKHRTVMADRRASAGFRPTIKEMLYPIVGQRANGARFWDVDGNEYVDLTMGFGVLLFGHAPAFLRRALSRQLRTGIQLGPQAGDAGPVASLITDMTGCERSVFSNSGTEAVMTALRLARTATKRTGLAMFAGAYHGHFDATLAAPRGGTREPSSTPLAPGIAPHMIADTLVLPYGDPAALETLRTRGRELAAILVEPVQSRRPDLQPAAFLKELRKVATDCGVALIFDEIITGFRIAPGGAQAWFDVPADIAVYGKLLGGGLPIGVVAGKAAYLDAIDGGAWNFGDDSIPSELQTFFAGTFNKNPLSMSAAKAVLRELKRRGPDLQADLNARTEALTRTLNDTFAEHGAPLRAVRFGSMFRFEHGANMDPFFYELLNRGVYIWEGRTCFLSTAHESADLERVVEAVGESLANLKQGGFISLAGTRPGGSTPGGAGLSRTGADDPFAHMGDDEFVVKLAETEAEVAAAQTLRYRVFYEERGAKPSKAVRKAKRDVDEFDPLCEHILVIDKQNGETVGTYRLRRPTRQTNEVLFSASEFDLEPLLRSRANLLELGRSCVAQAYRSRPVLLHLWRGIMEYALQNRIDLMFGCASFPGTDPESISEELAYLYHYHLAPPAICVRPQPGRYVEMNCREAAQIDIRRARAALPPVIRGYLQLGALVGDGAVVDVEFNTVDVAVILRTDLTREFLSRLDPGRPD